MNSTTDKVQKIFGERQLSIAMVVKHFLLASHTGEIIQNNALIHHGATIIPCQNSRNIPRGSQRYSLARQTSF